MKKGVLDEGYHSPTQIAAVPLETRALAGPNPVDIYLQARYHTIVPEYADYWSMRSGFKKLIRAAKSPKVAI